MAIHSKPADVVGRHVSPANPSMCAIVDGDSICLFDTSKEGERHWLNNATLTGHTEWVESVAFSPDGRTLASASYDKTIRVWSVADGSLLRTLTGHTESVVSVAFSPDGRTLASASGDNTIRVWSAADGSLLRTLTGHTKYVVSVAFSPDGRTLASASGDKTIRVWSVADGSLLRTLTGHTEWVLSVAFSPDGRTLASASDDNTIRVWSVAEGFLLGSVETSPLGWITALVNATQTSENAFLVEMALAVWPNLNELSFTSLTCPVLCSDIAKLLSAHHAFDTSAISTLLASNLAIGTSAAAVAAQRSDLPLLSSLVSTTKIRIDDSLLNVDSPSTECKQFLRSISQNDVPHFIALLRSRNLQRIETLLDTYNMTDVTVPGSATEQHALHLAVQLNSVDITRMLLERGASPNVTDSHTCTPLMLAVRSGSKDLVELMLSYGADGSMADDQGVTPLYTACEAKGTALVQLLVSYGADTNAPNASGVTPLLCATETNAFPIVELLLAHRANPDAVLPDSGHTALHRAVKHGHVEIAKALLDANCSLTATNADGNTALTLARKAPKGSGVFGTLRKLKNHHMHQHREEIATAIEKKRVNPTTTPRFTAKVNPQVPKSVKPRPPQTPFAPSSSSSSTPHTPSTPTGHDSSTLFRETRVLGEHETRNRVLLVDRLAPSGQVLDTLVLKVFESEEARNTEQTHLAELKKVSVPVVSLLGSSVYQGKPCLELEAGKHSLAEWLTDALEDGHDRQLAVRTHLGTVYELLTSLHTKGGRMHGDIKLDNIVAFGRAGTSYRLIDFGTARVLGESVSDEWTISYAPPEIAEWLLDPTSHSSAPVATSAIDMWQFGVMAFHAVAGEPLFSGKKSRATMLQTIAAWPDQCAGKIEARLRAARGKQSMVSTATDESKVARLLSKFLERDACAREAMTARLGEHPLMGGVGTGRTTMAMMERKLAMSVESAPLQSVVHLESLLETHLTRVEQLVTRDGEETRLALEETEGRMTTQIQATQKLVMEVVDAKEPRLFALIPADATNKWRDFGAWGKTTFQLHALCECGPHFVGGDEGVRLRVPGSVLRKMLPGLKTLFTLLSAAARIAAASAGLGAFIPDGCALLDMIAGGAEMISGIIEGMDEAIERQLDTMDAAELSTHHGHALGETLTALRDLMRDNDADFAGLRQQKQSDGSILWVCSAHF